MSTCVIIYFDIKFRKGCIFVKKRLFSLILILSIFLGSMTVFASNFEDTEAHWAKDYIDRVVESNLFNGVSESQFAPDSTMTRAMFVTVLGRYEGIDLDFWSSSAAPDFFEDVPQDSYYAPYVRWAVCNQIVEGMSEQKFLPDAPITREQMAKLIAFYVEKMGYTLLPTEQEIPENFADSADISDWAWSSVDALRTSGILNGVASEEGTVSFLPKNTATRAEAAAVFCRIADAVVKNETDIPKAQSISLNESQVQLNPGENFQLTATVTPEECTYFYRTNDSSVVTVDESGTVRAVGHGSTEIGVYTASGTYDTCIFEVKSDLPGASDTYAEKCMRVFGEVVSDPRAYYAIYDENGNRIGWDYERAKADMVTITVDTWDINKNGEKYTRKFTIDVHKNLADTYRQIFKEIYEGEEKFPFYYVWSYSKSGYSEHTIGTAVDLNPNENYYYNPRTGQQVGEYWKPGEDPYSIPLDGEVARIFAKYGFKQGAYWNSGTKDYMHFSFFAT